MPARTASQIVCEPVRWLWEPWLPAGKLAVLDGDPGLGKSSLTCELAAKFSRADSPTATLLVGAEDDAASAVVPRLSAAGADLDHVRVMDAADPLRLPADTDRLRAEIVAAGARLAVIDSLAACLERGASPNTDHTVRAALMPLVRVAAETDCAILVVRHLRKDHAGPAIYRGLGSIGVVAAARVAWLLTKHPADASLRVLTMTKSNLGPLPAPKVFAVTDGQVTWRADDADLTADASPPPRMTVEDWLETVLAKGCRPADEVLAEAAAAGIAPRTLERAKAALFVVSRRQNKVWFWCRPGQDPNMRFGGLSPMPCDLTSEVAPIPALRELETWEAMNTKGG